MYAHQPYSSHSAPRAEAEDNLFHRRKGNRPSSAKANQTPSLRKPPRPSSATRGQDNLNRVPSHYEPDPAVLARLKPRSITLEKERLYEDALTLKMEMNWVKEENVKLRTKIQQMEKERLRREEVLEDSRNKEQYYGKTAQSQHLVGSLKLAIKDLKAELTTKEEELTALRKNLKSTKVQEIEIEVQAYIDECTRLRHHLEEVMTTGINPAIATYEQRLREQEEQLQLWAQESDELKEALRSAQNEVQKWRERMVGVRKKPKRKGEAQQLKAEVQKLRAQLDAKDKKQAKTSDSTPKRKEPSPKQSKGVQSTEIKPESKPPSERPSEKGRDLHNLEQPRRVETKHPELVVEAFLGKVNKLLLERKLSLAVLLAYIYRSETGYCSAAELYTGLQTQGMAVDREEVETVVRTVGDAGRLSSNQFQVAFKKYEAAKNSFSAYDESTPSSRTNEPKSRPTNPPVEPPKPPPTDKKEAPSPMPPVPAPLSDPPKPQEVPKVQLAQVKALLTHFSYRLQLQRLPKSKLFQAVFGSPFEKEAIVTLADLSESLAHPPMTFQLPQETQLLARFLLEPTGPPASIKEADLKALRGTAKDIIARLSSSLGDWVVFTQEDEGKFDHAIATALQRNKMAFKASCKSYDLHKTGIIAFSELLEIIKNLELKLGEDVVHYMALLFYSHRQELDQVPYKEFIKAFTEQQPQQVEEHKASSEPDQREQEEEYGEEEYGEEEADFDREEEDEEINEEDRAQIARYYLEQIAEYLKGKKLKAEELFETEDGYIMPEGLVNGLLQIPGLQPQKTEIRVFLEALQDEEMEELCISLDSLEMLLEHYGVPRGQESSAQAKEPTPEKRVSMLEEAQ